MPPKKPSKKQKLRTFSYSYEMLECYIKGVVSASIAGSGTVEATSEDDAWNFVGQIVLSLFAGKWSCKIGDEEKIVSRQAGQITFTPVQ